MGLLFTSAFGSGTTEPAVTAIVNLSAQLATKVMMRVDGIRNAASSHQGGTSMGVYQIDANGAGGFKKLEALIDFNFNNTTCRYRHDSPGQGGSETLFVSLSAFPANGNDLILYNHWDQTHFNHSLGIADATGTFFITSSTNLNDGNLSVTASNGILTLNASWDGFTAANMYHGIAIYSSSQPFASWSKAPFTNEATLVYLAKFNDPPSPTIASASVGATGLTLETPGNYYWFLDSASAQIWFPPTSIPSTISLTLPTTYMSIGGFAGITASIFNQLGAPVSGGIQWSVQPNSIAQINAVGTVTASQSGTAFVTATLIGSTLTGSGIVSVSAYNWSSNNLSIVTVDVTGTFTYRGGVGLATITCSRVGTPVVGYAGITGSAVSTINISPVGMTASIETVSITAVSGSGSGGGGGGGVGASLNAAHPNEPSGFLVQIDTGQITGSTSAFNTNMANGAGTWTTLHNGISKVWSNFSVGVSSSTSNGTTECGYMIELASGSGIRQRFDPQLAGGNNYVSWGTGIPVSGSGGLYMSAMVRFVNWSNKRGDGTFLNVAAPKMWEPRCGGPNNNGGQENHVVGGYCNGANGATGSYIQFLKQINRGAQDCTLGGGCANGSDNNYFNNDQGTGLASQYNPLGNLFSDSQEYHQIECIFIQESIANTTSDARIIFFVDQVLAFDSARDVSGQTYNTFSGSLNLLAANSIRGWYYWMFNSVWGGASPGTQNPTQIQYFDVDQLYCSVSPGYLANNPAVYAQNATFWTGSAGTNFPHELPGMTPVLWTGPIPNSTVINYANAGTWTTNYNGTTTTWTMNSPSTIDGNGQVSTNLTIPPNNTGYRLAFSTSLTPGATPVQFFPNGFSTIGTGYYYMRWLIKCGDNWNNGNQNGGNPGNKVAEPRTNVQGPASTQVNDFFGISAQNAGDGFGWVTFGLQGVSTYGIPRGDINPGLDFGIQGCYNNFQGLAANSSQGNTTIGNIGGPFSSSFHLVEYLFTPESVIGAGDGTYAMWVDGQAAYTQSAIQWRPTGVGAEAGWLSFYIGPTFGGAKSGPSVNTFYEIDQIYISVK